MNILRYGRGSKPYLICAKLSVVDLYDFFYLIIHNANGGHNVFSIYVLWRKVPKIEEGGQNFEIY